MTRFSLVTYLFVFGPIERMLLFFLFFFGPKIFSPTPASVHRSKFRLLQLILLRKSQQDIHFTSLVQNDLFCFLFFLFFCFFFFEFCGLTPSRNVDMGS
jgi:hypothetical protein